MTYSRDFRSKVIATREKEKLSMAEAAKRFDVGVASIMRWSKNIDSKLTRNKPATKIDMEALKRDVEQYPDAYQYERAQRLNVSNNCVGCALKRLNVTYKKNTAASKSGSRKTLCFLRDTGSV